MNIVTIGLDLAKHVFQVHGIDNSGRAVLRRRLRRAEVEEFFTTLPPCLVGMEACGSAHYWARRISALGHEVRLIAPSRVKPASCRKRHSYFRLSRHADYLALASRSRSRKWA